MPDRRRSNSPSPLGRSSLRTVYATSTRRAVVDLLQREERYLSAAAIYRHLHTGSAPVALSTVYRTLERLVLLGTVSSRSDETGETTYVFCAERHHHHAICRVCGHVDEVACEAMDVFRDALLAQQSFALDDHSIEFFGRCARCR